jgi:hypothetical protein
MMFVPHRKHTYRPPRPVTEIFLLSICRLCSYLRGNTSTELHGLLREYLYVDVRTSQETPIDIHDLLRGYLYFLYKKDFIPHRKHIYKPPRPITGRALLSFVRDTMIYAGRLRARFPKRSPNPSKLEEANQLLTEMSTRNLRKSDARARL